MVLAVVVALVLAQLAVGVLQVVVHLGQGLEHRDVAFFVLVAVFVLVMM
jgi:hypothetical protein